MLSRFLKIFVYVLLLQNISIPNSNSAEILKFNSTMDRGALGNPRTLTSADDWTFRLEYWPNSADPDIGYLYFGDYVNQLNGLTSNQLISAKMVLTYNSGTISGNSDVQGFLIESSWSEAGMTYISKPSISIVGNPDNSKTSLAGLTTGKSFSINLTDAVKMHLSGTPNYGFAIRRTYPSSVREEGTADGAPRIVTREHQDLPSRPYLELIFDSSRPKYPAPTDAPAGLNLTSTTGSATVTWTSISANTDNVKVDFSCSISGSWSTTVNSSQRSVTRTNLRGGERCSVRATASNAAGSSPTSMSTPEVTISGSGPAAAPATSLVINGSQATASISNISSDATELIVTLSCSSGGQQSQTVPSGQLQVAFNGVREGDTCSAYTQARNQWGSSPTGAPSSSITSRGNPPSAIAFNADSPSQGSVRLSWSSVPSGASSIDAILQCQKAGQLTRTLSTSDRTTTFSGLSAGDTCTPTMWASNQWGSSPRTSNSAISIRGNAPATPRITQLTADVPEEFSIYLDIPSDATSLDLTVRCDSSGTDTFTNLSTTNSVKTIKQVPAGDTCYVAVSAKNSWGTSSTSSFSGPITVKGNAPTQAPSGVSVAAGVEQITIKWSSAPADVLIEVTAYCTISGTRKAVVRSNQYSYAFPAVAGESCYATLASKNDWGSSPQSSRSLSATVAKPASSSSSNSSTSNSSSNSATKKPTTTTNKPAPTTTKKSTTPNSSTSKVLICIKGSQIKTVTGANPKCPSGWVKKPTISKA